MLLNRGGNGRRHDQSARDGVCGALVVRRLESQGLLHRDGRDFDLGSFLIANDTGSAKAEIIGIYRIIDQRGIKLNFHLAVEAIHS